MEIPGSDNLRIDKSKAVRDRGKVGTGPSVQNTGDSGSTSAKPAQGADRAAISSKAKETQLASSIAKSSPDIRAEIVGPIKERYEAGQYEVGSHKIADKILQDLIKESDFLG